MADIGATVYYNLNRRERDPSRFEGRASNMAVPKKIVPAFRAYLEDRGEELLDEADRWLGERELATLIERTRNIRLATPASDE